MHDDRTTVALIEAALLEHRWTARRVEQAIRRFQSFRIKPLDRLSTRKKSSTPRQSRSTNEEALAVFLQRRRVFRAASLALGSLSCALYAWSLLLIALGATFSIWSEAELASNFNGLLFDTSSLSGVVYTVYTVSFFSAAIVAIVTIIARLFIPRNMLRMTLLRPFHQKTSRALRKFVRHNLGLFGYTATLSDPKFKPSFSYGVTSTAIELGTALVTTTNVSFLYLPFMRIFDVSPRLITVTKYSRLLKMLRRMKKTRKLLGLTFPNMAVLWLFGAGQAFNVRTTDRWWKATVASLFDISEVVFVDLTDVKGGTEWEIETLKARGIVDQAIFIVREDHAAQALALLRDGFGIEDRPLVAYDARGRVAEPEAFAGHVASAAFARLDRYWSVEEALRARVKRSASVLGVAS